MLPTAVAIDLERDSLRSYWQARARQHTQDSYAGVRLSKFPEDLRVYEHLLWLDAPDAVIEIGTQFGASALWLRDRLRALRAYGRIASEPRVISLGHRPVAGPPRRSRQPIATSVARSRFSKAMSATPPFLRPSPICWGTADDASW